MSCAFGCHPPLKTLVPITAIGSGAIFRLLSMFYWTEHRFASSLSTMAH